MDGYGLVDGLLAAVGFLSGRFHLDTGNPNPDRADDVVSADDANPCHDGELFILLWQWMALMEPQLPSVVTRQGIRWCTAGRPPRHMVHCCLI